jgi:hypothetical protein
MSRLVKDVAEAGRRFWVVRMTVDRNSWRDKVIQMVNRCIVKNDNGWDCGTKRKLVVLGVWADANDR